MKLMNSIHNTLICLNAKAYFEKESKFFNLRGQKARTLFALIQAGTDGITSLEISSWAFRTSAYIHELRNDPYNLDIQTIREEHRGGWHARYILHTSVEILNVEYN